MLVLLLAFVGLYIYVQLLAGGVVAPPPANYTPEYSYSVGGTGVVDNGEQGQRSLYIIYGMQGKDISRADFSAEMYRSEIPSDIYLLDYPCESCTTLPDFKSSLEAGLKAQGIIPADSTLVSVKFNQLERIEKGAIIIVPTGRLPSVLFDSNSSANLNRLMERGCVIVYIGSDFSLWMTRTGSVESVPLGALGQYNLSEAPSQQQPADGNYTFEGGPYRLSGNSTIYDSAINVLSLSKGYFVAFPNFLDLGWNSRGGGNGTAAAQDVARFISEVGWQEPVATGNRTLAADYYGVINATDSIFLSPSAENGGYVRLYAAVTTLDSRSLNEHHDLNISNPVTGRLFNANFAVNGSIIPVKLELHENFSEPREFELFLTAYKDGKIEQQQNLGLVNFVTDYSTEKRYTINLTGGDYLLRINDISGKAYAQSLLHIPLVAAQLVGADWDNGIFTFALLSDGKPVDNTNVLFSMDSLPQVTLKTDGAGILTYKPADKPGFGDHSFSLSATGRSFTLKASRVKQETFFDKPMNQGIIVVTFLVLIIGVALRRTEPPKYFIDVPDFPPQQKERIPLSRFALTNLMENINKEYRWKWMPLTAQEIKAGVRKRITYQGRPVLISDYNLDKLLRSLSESGDVTKALGSWEKQSGKSARYLAMFRQLRNFLISHAILFTDVGQRQDCDILVNYRGENIFIHIYEDEEAVRRALLCAKKGKNFIVFESREQLHDFTQRLGPAPTRLAVALKMEMGSRQVMLTHIESLGPIIGMSELR